MVALIQEGYLRNLMKANKSFSSNLSYPKFLTAMLSDEAGDDSSAAAT